MGFKFFFFKLFVKKIVCDIDCWFVDVVGVQCKVCY